MEISPQGKDAIKSRLCQFMSDDEAARSIDLEYAMDVIKQGQSCWQAPVSIGIHSAEPYLSAKAEGDNAGFQVSWAWRLSHLRPCSNSCRPCRTKRLRPVREILETLQQR